MSLSFREYIFVAVSLLAGVWFFVGYPSQDPRSLIDISKTDSKVIEQQAKEKLDSLGISRSDYKMEVQFYSNRTLLEGVQQSLGRDEMVRRFTDSEAPNMKLYYWTVQIEFADNAKQRSDDSADSVGVRDAQGQGEASISMHFSPSGEFLELSGIDTFLDEKNVNSSALARTFGKFSNDARTVLQEYSGDFLEKHLMIDVQQNWSQYDLSDEDRVAELKNALAQRQAFRLSSQAISDIAMHHLQETGWDISTIKQDTVQLGRISGKNTATARFHSSEDLFDQQLSLEVQVLKTGGLVSINSTYDTSVSRENRQLWMTVRGALLFLFGLTGVVIFFFRIRARAIDTQPALVVAVMSGLAFSMVVLLTTISNTSIFSVGESWSESIELILRTGLVGAAASLAYFVFFAIGDSLTRQNWPRKLAVYDYLRQGMVFNKPIGFMLVRSVMLAFILAGIWTSVLWILPQISFHIHNEVFLSQQVAWPPVFLGLSNGVYSLGLVIGIFLVLGGQAVAQTRSKIIASALMIVACGVVVPYAGYLEANGYQFIGGTMLGAAMLGIYLKWDFLTLLLSHFFFSLITSTATGWIIAGSMDAYIFVMVLILMGVVLSSGFVAIAKGKRENLLSRYVPEYVEELAQEERIKQELQIAREVQQSFLPIRKPHFNELDLAALCKPAYETGGDYYDFVQLDEHRLAVTIGDVSGKGFQAAFYMTFIKGILHSLCREIDSPAEILKKVNRLFYENAQRGTFISLVYGIIDLKKRTFRFARAGHNPILRVGGNNSNLEELKPKGIGIGLSRDHFDEHLEEVELSIAGNNLLVLYTDGIVEAQSESQKFYGSKRLNKMIKQHSHKSSQEILDLLAQDVKSFIGEAKQHDDMTIMVMKLKDEEE